jgi:hypothetical protein
MLEFQSGMYVRPCRNINKDGKKQQQQTHTVKKKKTKTIGGVEKQAQQQTEVHEQTLL